MIDMPVKQQHLSDRLHTAISDNPYLANRYLRFETEAGRVTLHGVVSSFFHKQMAQEELRRIDGVELIENLLEVNWA
jgi:osmotically-inducible protein OsmY